MLFLNAESTDDKMFAKAFVASGSVQLQFSDAFTIAAFNLQYIACMPLNASISEQKK